jgi:hypothetical protein
MIFSQKALVEKVGDKRIMKLERVALVPNSHTDSPRTRIQSKNDGGSNSGTDYAYSEVAEAYKKQATNQLVLGLTTHR